MLPVKFYNTKESFQPLLVSECLHDVLGLSVDGYL